MTNDLFSQDQQIGYKFMGETDKILFELQIEKTRNTLNLDIFDVDFTSN